jgi:2-keto-4-pentenoate hydratase/2-oxohepta-3-ene-1,7-dioic acid hydratase in catechol pathway
MNYTHTPPDLVAAPVVGSSQLFPVHRIYCVGRNYVEHAKEMGFTGREPPFFFLKPADALVVVPQRAVVVRLVVVFQRLLPLIWHQWVQMQLLPLMICNLQQNS